MPCGVNCVLAEVCAMMLLPSGLLMRREEWLSNRNRIHLKSDLFCLIKFNFKKVHLSFTFHTFVSALVLSVTVLEQN